LRFKYAELPSLEGMVVSACALIGYVEFQTRPVKASWLAYGFDIRSLEREKDAKATKDDFVPLLGGDERLL